MDHVEPLRVEFTLELASQADPPSGRITVDGISHPFTGRLGLALALEAAIDAGRNSQQLLQQARRDHA